MRRRLLWTAALAAALGTLPVGAAPPPDWIVVSATAGPDGATDLQIRVRGNAQVRGGAPALIGFGFADRIASLVDVVPVGSGAIRVTTTKTVGGVDQTVAPDPGGRDITVDSTMLADTVRPYERVALLVFVAGMSFDEVTIDEPTTSSGAVTSWTRTGDGSTSIRAAGPGDEGIGSAAGPVAIGSSTIHHRDLADGIVGGFVTGGFCAACSGSWHAPDDRSAPFRSVEGGAAGLSSGTPSFVGDRGAWTWTWTGVGLTRAGALGTAPAFAAYAPVGEIWPLFRPLGV